jgi:hypothetical protein
MASLRNWLMVHEWFILQCDPGPVYWSIWALSPTGGVLSFHGTEAQVDGWDSIPSLTPIL